MLDNISLIIVEGSALKTVTDKEQLASLITYKHGKVMTKANVADDGVAFSYTE